MMKHYNTFRLEDFVGDEDFRNWIQAQSNDEFWVAFLENYPEKEDLLKQAGQIIRTTHVLSDEIGEREIQEEVERFFKTTGSVWLPDLKPDLHSSKRFFSFSRIYLVAAIVLICAGLGWYLLLYNQTEYGVKFALSGNSRMVETVNDSNKPLRLVLNDNSVVMLSPNSRLKYPSEFAGNERTVYLVGEAGFSVTHMSRPFMVYTGEMVTKVLGTRFVVRAFDKDKKISVQVQSGKVSVYSTTPSQSDNSKEIKGVILTANQAAIFGKEDQQLSKTLVTSPIVVAKDNKVVNYFYDEVPFPVILRELEKGYGIAIQFDEQNFEKCMITATLSNETLYEKLDLLCKTMAATYQIVDGQIAISGAGCH